MRNAVVLADITNMMRTGKNGSVRTQRAIVMASTRHTMKNAMSMRKGGEQMENVVENNDLPLDRKYSLTVEEASRYSGIGTKKLYAMLDKPGCSFVLHIGRKKLVKRQKFENYLDSRVEI